MLVLMTDTDCDVTPKIAEELGYKTLLSMPYSIGDKEIRPYEDEGYVFDSKPYYDMLRAGTVPTTTCLTKDDYIRYFEPEFAAGNDILYVHFSTVLSSSFDFMKIALNELNEKYPERKFYEIDTKLITFAALPIVYEVSNLYKAGKTIDEILEWANTEVDKYACYMYVNDLRFFKASGRVKGISAIMGSLIGIKPIIYINEEGYMISHSKTRGRMNALNQILEYVDQLGDDIQNHYIVLGHTDMADDAEFVKEKLIEKYGKNLKIIISVTNPTAGSKSGPDGFGIAFHAIHR